MRWEARDGIVFSVHNAVVAFRTPRADDGQATAAHRRTRTPDTTTPARLSANRRGEVDIPRTTAGKAETKGALMATKKSVKKSVKKAVKKAVSAVKKVAKKVAPKAAATKAPAKKTVTKAAPKAAVKKAPAKKVVRKAVKKPAAKKAAPAKKVVGIF